MITTEVGGDVSAVVPSTPATPTGTLVPPDPETPEGDDTNIDPRQVRVQVYPQVNF